MEDLYAVMGNPVNHSKSPFIHKLFANQTNESLKYIKIEVPLNGFETALDQFIAQQGKGLNITAPFKQQAFKAVTDCSERAKIAQSVNTIKIQPGSELYGDNTDGVGLVRDLTLNQHYSLANKTILILGAGGAARGILYPLILEKPKQINLANRTLQKAVEIGYQFKDWANIEVSNLNEIKGCFDLIINCINLSAQKSEITLPTTILTKSTFCYDLMYGQSVTPFLKWAACNGVSRMTNGLGMLVEQAAESFFLWRGVKPNTQSVIDKLKQFYS